MNIFLTVEFYTPSVGGAQEVVKQLAERLVRRGHAVTVATSAHPGRTSRDINGVRVVDFPVRGNLVRGIEGPVEEYQAFLRQSRFDVMLNYAAQQWSTDLAYPLVGTLPYPVLLAPCGFSGLNQPDYGDYFAQLPAILRRYDRLILHSATYRDAEFLRAHGLTHTVVISNGAGEDEFGQPDATFRRRFGIPKDALLCLTVGSHTGLKGHKLVLQAFKRAKIGKAVLLVIGNTFSRHNCLSSCRKWALLTNVTQFGRKRVHLLDPPRADVVAAYHAADLFLFGSNVECSPLVLFEALASGTPFLTLGCGNAAEIIDWSGGGELLPTFAGTNGRVEGRVEDMTAGLERLAADREARARLGVAGRQAWHARFTWEHIVTEYERVFQETIDGWAGKAGTA